MCIRAAMMRRGLMMSAYIELVKDNTALLYTETHSVSGLLGIPTKRFTLRGVTRGVGHSYTNRVLYLYAITHDIITVRKLYVSNESDDNITITLLSLW